MFTVKAWKPGQSVPALVLEAEEVRYHNISSIQIATPSEGYICSARVEILKGHSERSIFLVGEEPDYPQSPSYCDIGGCDFTRIAVENSEGRRVEDWTSEWVSVGKGMTPPTVSQWEAQNSG